MTKAGPIALLLSILVVTVVHSHSIGNNNNKNNNYSPWKSLPGLDKTKWNNLSWYLKKLPVKQFMGMRFILNITGEACAPRWHWPKPSCWGHGWPWPWPGHSTSTTRGVTTRRTTPIRPTTDVPRTTARGTTSRPTTVRATTGRPTTVRATTGRPTTVRATTGRPTTVRETTGRPTTVGQTTRVPTTAVPTTTTTTTTTRQTTVAQTTGAATTQPPATTPGGPETTSCPYTIDILDQHYCRDLRGLLNTKPSGPLYQCAKYYSNETLNQFYNECLQFQCKYQRAYVCYGEWPFVQNCSHYLQEDESMIGWRYNQDCPQNSSPFPDITFTDLVTTGAPTQAVAKRSIDEEDDGTEGDDDNAIDEGTESVAFGIKNNWCVPRIYSWWWRRHGGKLPGQSSSDEDWWDQWSDEKDDDSKDGKSSEDKSSNGGKGPGGKKSSEEKGGKGPGGKGGKKSSEEKGGKGPGGKGNNNGPKHPKDDDKSHRG